MEKIKRILKKLEFLWILEENKNLNFFELLWKLDLQGYRRNLINYKDKDLEDWLDKIIKLN